LDHEPQLLFAHRLNVTPALNTSGITKPESQPGERLFSIVRSSNLAEALQRQFRGMKTAGRKNFPAVHARARPDPILWPEIPFRRHQPEQPGFTAQQVQRFPRTAGPMQQRLAPATEAIPDLPYLDRDAFTPWLRPVHVGVQDGQSGIT